jgi:hypothetical protein
VLTAPHEAGNVSKDFSALTEWREGGDGIIDNPVHMLAGTFDADE